MAEAGRLQQRRVPSIRRRAVSGVMVLRTERSYNPGGDREISRLRNDPRHRADLCEEAGAGLRLSRVRRHPAGARSPARGDRLTPASGIRLYYNEINVAVRSGIENLPSSQCEPALFAGRQWV